MHHVERRASSSAESLTHCAFFFHQIVPQDTIRPPVIREQGVPNPGRLIARLAASTSSWWSGPAADANQVTELAESQASERTIVAIAGHISPRMLEHYSHIRMEPKRKGLDAPVGGVWRGGMAQTTTQNRTRNRRQGRKSLKRMVGTTGLEPAASAVTDERQQGISIA